MEETLHAADILQIITLTLVGGQAAGFIFWIKFEIEQIRKDMVANDTAIEEKRLANVAYLKEIYDAKIDDSKKYAKGLFETQSGEIRAILSRMVGVENSLTKIIDLLMNKK